MAVPEMYDCGGCGKALRIWGREGYELEKMPDVPAEMIHENRDARFSFPVILMCTCGHVTTIEPPPRQ